jgi:hypothetical protein
MNCSKCNERIPPLENHGADTEPLCYSCACPEELQPSPIVTYKPKDKWRSVVSIAFSVILMTLVGVHPCSILLGQPQEGGEPIL